MSYELHAVVLGVRDNGETEQYVELLTESYGRMSVLSRGAKHMKAKLTPHLQPGNVGYVQLLHRKRAEEPLVIGADITHRGARISTDPAKTLELLHVLELATKLTMPRVPDEMMFQYCVKLINLLAKTPLEQVRWAIRSFELSMLSAHGYAQAQSPEYGTIKSHEFVRFLRYLSNLMSVLR